MKLRNILRIMAVAAFLILAVSVTASAADYYVDAEVSGDTAGELSHINPVQNVFFLPGDTDISSVKLRTTLTGVMYRYPNDQTKYGFYPNGTVDLTSGMTTDANGDTCYQLIMISGEKEKTYTFYKGDGIGTVYISTSAGISYINRSKDNRDTGAIAHITDKDGELMYSDYTGDTLSEIKGRGNATFGYVKKPYQLKLSSKTDLFGMGKAKTWILLANYIDSSFIKNSIAYRLADGLGMPYTPMSVYVNLYIDNTYYGVYQLIEKTQIGKTRINITDLEDVNALANPGKELDLLSTVTVKEGALINDTNLRSYTYVSGMFEPEDITGGYLVELDNLYSYGEKCKFTTDIGNTYVIKSPECASKSEVEYIAKLFAAFEEALYSKSGYNSEGRHYSEYCDITSLCRVYTIDEATKNWDAYIGSTFFYKDVDTDGHVSMMYAGPVWDFDNTWGNLTNGTFASNLTELWADGNNNYGGSKYKSDFGAALTSHPEAMAIVSELYADTADMIYDMLYPGGYIEELVDRIYPSVEMDRLRWDNSGRNRAFKTFDVYSDGADSSPVDTAIGYLRNFMKVRTDALVRTFLYTLPAGYYSVEDTTGKAELYSPYYKAGDSVKVRTDDISSVFAFDGSGNSVKLNDNGDGSYFFIMPGSKVVLKSSPAAETTSENTVATETTAPAPGDTTATDAVTTEPLSTTDTSSEQTGKPEDKGDAYIWIAVGIIGGLLVAALVVYIIINNRKKK